MFKLNMLLTNSTFCAKSLDLISTFYSKGIMNKGQKIGYIRVSTIEQSIDRQLEGIQLDKKFIDKCSGRDTKRVQFENLMTYVREGDIIYVHSMDRLARNLFDLKKTVNELTNRGIIIQFVKENLIFTGDDTPISKLLLAVMGAVAEFERDILLERQREGIRIAKAQGKYKGAKKKLSPEQHLELKQMVENRWRKTEIAKHFNIDRGSVYKYMKD